MAGGYTRDNFVDWSKNIQLTEIIAITVDDFKKSRGKNRPCCRGLTHHDHKLVKFGFAFKDTISCNTTEVFSTKICKFSSCDLAGSERIKKTKAEGERLSEAQHINFSLLELGSV